MNTDYLFDDPYTLEDDEFDYDVDFYDEEAHISAQQFAIKMPTLVDGLQSLALIADTLRDYAEFLEAMRDEGYILSRPLIEGIGFAYQIVDGEG